METIRNQSAIQIQKNIRDNSEEVKNTLNDLYNWEKEMKYNEQKLNQKEQETIKPPPVRSHIAPSEVQTEKQVTANVKPENNKLFEAEEEEQKRKVQADIFNDRGNKHVKLGEYAKAILQYTLAIEKYKANPKYYTNRALCHLKQERYGECIEDCDRAIEIDNMTVKAYYRRMQANESLGFNTKALKDCTTVLMIDSNNREAKTSLQRINQRLKGTGAVPKGHKMPDYSAPRVGPSFSPLRSNMLDILPINKPSYARSKKALKRIPIIDVIGPKDGKNFENSNIQISDEVLEKLFNGECGSFEEVKKTSNEKAINKNLESDSNKLSPEKNLTKPTKVSKLEAELALLTKDRPLPPPPTTTAQFYCNWKELSAEQKYHYFKSIQIPQLNKILGAGFDSETLTDLLKILKEYYVPNKENVCETLLEISKHDRLPILSLLLSDEDKDALCNAISYASENKEYLDTINIIRRSFSLKNNSE